MKNKLVILVCTGLLGGILVGCSDTSSSTPVKVDTSQTQPAKTAPSAPPAPPKQTEFKVGDTIKAGNTELIVNTVTKSQGGDYDKPQKPGDEFVIVKVTFKNDGQDKLDYNPLDFKLQNSQGQITDETFSTVNQDTALQSGSLAGGGTVSGTIIFEEPKNDSKLQLQYQSDVFDDNSVVKVNLN